MRTMLRAGAIALAASSVLLAGGVAAQAAPAAADVTFTVGNLIFEPQQWGHTGSLEVTITNHTDQDVDKAVTVLEPLAGTFDDATGTQGCLIAAPQDGRQAWDCYLGTIPAGESVTVNVVFYSPAAGKPVARRATTSGSIEIDGKTVAFPAVFRSTSGSVANPVAYTPDQTANLTVTTPGNVTLTRQDDGTFAGRIPVTLTGNGDAGHQLLGGQMAAPAGLTDWPYAVDGNCGPGDVDLPVPPGGTGVGCAFFERLAQGQTRTYDWLFTAPADSQPGPLGTATTSGLLNSPLIGAQTDGANKATFTVTIAG
ncbi:hypothetical protein [Actinoplanes sp. NPDC049265]|uniref:hypothetical protein n=1 Tax=Actinoplanes sp. NPDC049265 TaxID=3363902 RepID=UPI00371FB362